MGKHLYDDLGGSSIVDNKCCESLTIMAIGLSEQQACDNAGYQRCDDWQKPCDQVLAGLVRSHLENDDLDRRLSVQSL